MTTKEQVAAILENGGENFISGGDIARKIGISRNAVWKAVNALEADGCVIEAVRNKGYRLTRCADVMSVEGIERFIKHRDDFKVELYDLLPSTNLTVKERAQNGEPEGFTVIASRQSAGRGRLGRSFYSPAGGGVYMSLLLRPKIPPEDCGFITTAAAVAVCMAIRQVFGAESGIKWVNDIFIGGRKVCGILTEAALDLENNYLSYAVLGIGINVYPPEGGFPDDIADIAGAISETPVKDGRNRLVAAVLDNFRDIYGKFDTKSIASYYRENSIVIGRNVTVLRGGNAAPAYVEDIDDRCRLVVKYGDGTEEALSSGEISIRL